jgi:hypothetical protein
MNSARESLIMLHIATLNSLLLAAGAQPIIPLLAPETEKSAELVVAL